MTTTHGSLGIPLQGLALGPTVNHGFQIRLFMHYAGLLKTHPAGQDKLLQLKDDPRIEALTSRLITRGRSGFLFDLNTLVMWWMWRANETNKDTANTDLERFLDAEVVDTLVVHWVHGVKTASSISVTDSVQIVSPEEMIDSDDKEDVCRLPDQPFSSISIKPTAALIATCSVRRDSDQNISLSVVDDDLNTVSQNLAEVALLLNCMPSLCCVTGYCTTYAPPHVPFGPFSGRAGGGTRRDITPQSTCLLDNFDETHFRAILCGFRKLSSSWKVRFEQALSRFSQSKSRENVSDKLLDLGIALEMVLLNSEQRGELPGQLHSHFRSRGAWLTGQDFDDRKHTYKLLGEIYSLRSQVAHNGKAESLEKISHEEREQKIDAYISMAEKIFCALLTNGPPREWSDLVLGGTD